MANNDAPVAPTENGVDADSDYEDLQLPDEEDGVYNAGKTLSRLGLVIPFRAIHKTCRPFKDPARRVYLPGQEIVVKITEFERTVSTHLLNPNLYVIQFQHGEFQWVVRRRYKHFQHLHQQLQLFRTGLSIPFPTRTHKERRASYKPKSKSSSRSLPRFPKKPDALIPVEQLPERMKQLEDYLSNLLKSRFYRNHHDTLEFMEVSHLSFINQLGVKSKEGPVLKRTGHSRPRRATFGLCGMCYTTPCLRVQRVFGDCCGQWRTRWMMVKDSFVAYVRPKDGNVKCVMLMDQGFEASSGLYETGFPSGVVLSNLSRQLVVKLWTKRKAKEWLDQIREMANTHGKEYIQPNRFGSFAPVREHIEGAWFVDGASYMEAVADAIESAQEEIFITDWWLSPEIYLKRPAIEGDRWRLDQVLLRKAQQGVKIFIMLYKEVELALGINSYYSKQTLVKQHPENIKVLRHPDHVSAGVFLWAHHEKLVIIDQSYAFVGGIDLCYGRWDDHRHRLTDLGSIGSPVANAMPYQRKITSSQPGGTGAPASILQLARATNTVTIGTMQTIVPPDADEAIIEETIVAEGIDVVDAAPTMRAETSNEPLKGETPKMKRRSMVQKMKERSRVISEGFHEKGFSFFLGRQASEDLSELPPPEESVEPTIQKEEQAAVEMTRMTSKIDTSDGLLGSAKLWIGKDYTNFIVKDFNNLELPFQDLVDRATTPRMPWHDIAVMVQGIAARDVARHFIQRWNAIKEEKVKLNNVYPYLLPKSNRDLKTVPPILNIPMYNVKAQVLRSTSQWSCGIQMIEDSIHRGYVEAIEGAKHYVYIENQFFITQSRNCLSVQNRIGEALLQRILRAHRDGACFRVFVVMPLLPGFEGEFGTSQGTAIQAITHWNYASLCRGDQSLTVRLTENGVEDPYKYLSFCGLRNHAELPGDVVTELIYVHSKLMIVDDNLVICGSANINDRSMLGKRDSEVAVMIEDEEFTDGTMNGEPYKSGKYAGSLRRQLFNEHLGQLENPRKVLNVEDPVSEAFFKDTWQATAEANTSLYEEVFNVIPTSKVRSFEALNRYFSRLPVSDADPPAARRMLEDIQGNLVQIPLDFLCEEDLTPSSGTKEALMPTSLWT